MGPTRDIVITGVGSSARSASLQSFWQALQEAGARARWRQPRRKTTLRPWALLSTILSPSSLSAAQSSEGHEPGYQLAFAAADLAAAQAIDNRPSILTAWALSLVRI